MPFAKNPEILEKKGRITVAFCVENPEISVIVPVYNVGEFVEKCISTLAEQSIKVPYEILAVNDGSTDESLKILQNMEQKYSNVCILNQKNSGVSVARQNGLKQARGKYICFVDGDDYVSRKYLEKLYQACKKNDAQIACCSYDWHFVFSGFYLPYPFRAYHVMSTERGLRMLIRDYQIQSFWWSKMIEKSVIIASHVTFPKMCFEDLAVLHRVFACADKVVLIPNGLYYYNVHTESTLGTMNPQKICDYIRAVAMVREGLMQKGLYAGKYRSAHNALASKSLSCCQWNVMKMHIEAHHLKGAMANLHRVHLLMKQVTADKFNPNTFYENLSGEILTSSGRKEADDTICSGGIK